MEMQENPVVIGVFGDTTQAERGIAELRHAGFRDDQIHFLGHESSGFFDTLREKLAGHETSSAGTADTLEALGIPQEEAAFYQHEYDQGRAVVAVKSYGHQDEARDILHRFGAYDANTGRQLEQVQTIPVREEQLIPRKHTIEVGQVYIRKVVVTEEKTITVSVSHEEIVIERRPVAGTTLGTSDTEDDENTGEARGTAVTGYASEARDTGAADIPLNGKIVELAEGETIRIPLRQEQIVIEKRPVVAEELIVGKKRVEEMQQFTDTVRREEPRVERVGNVNVHSKGIQDITDQTPA